MYRSGEAPDALNATFALAKGAASELDISSMSDGRQKVVYSFLSLEWAFIADVDIESERYRMFGGLRFTMSSVAKILSRHKQYNGTLRYLDSDQDARPPTKFHERTRDPLASNEEDVTRPALECLSQRDAQIQSQDPLLAATGQWKELSGSFHMFWAMNVTHAASDGHIAPMAGMDDGYFYLMLMEGPFSRVSLAKLLLGLEDGSHIGQKRVQVIRTRAFTLHTDNPTDLLCVDGELFKGPDIQVSLSVSHAKACANYCMSLQEDCVCVAVCRWRCIAQWVASCACPSEDRDRARSERESRLRIIIIPHQQTISNYQFICLHAKEWLSHCVLCHTL